MAPPKTRRSFSHEARCAPLRSLLMEDVPEVQREDVWQLSPTQLRDRLISLRPLDTAWIARVNQARAGPTILAPRTACRLTLGTSP